jgi:predicted helicase
MTVLNLKPTHKVISEYFNSLGNYNRLGFDNEGAVSPPFAVLLEWTAKQFKWSLVQQYEKKVKGKRIRIDGAVVDQWGLPHGYWEAKDSKDDLHKELKSKFAKGYPKDNFIIQEPAKAILVQNGVEIGKFDLLKAEELVRLIQLFFEYEPPAFDEWIQAEAKFREQLPELGQALLMVLEDAKSNNKSFQEAFANFYEICRTSINPNLSEKAVEEMLIQHILTERIFRTVFHNSEFTQRNVIAREIERVIMALTSEAFSREEFLKRFDHFYRALELRANSVESFAEKQTFLNNVYERFFQGFSVDVADTHGIVYTPESIVNFMVRSVEEILQKEFGTSLSDDNVHILDPFVGTGNFIVHIMDAIKKTALEHKYKHELHCNEVMLLPYYVASMNIEHEFYDKVGRYAPFEGICLVDTFDMAEKQQASLDFMTEENTARIRRQKSSPITVVIGNPPYNAWQTNENDNNKNRKYKHVDKRVAETYARDSKARNMSALSDPYVKAFRWASDRIEKNGILAFVTNDGFIDAIATDGMRKHLAQDFDALYILHLGGDVRQNPKLSGTTHNVFGIQVGVSINVFVKKRPSNQEAGRSEIKYYSTDEFWKKEQKYSFLNDRKSISGVSWISIIPDEAHNWLTDGMSDDFRSLIPMGTKARTDNDSESALFSVFSNGIKTNRDPWCYSFTKTGLERNVQLLMDVFNTHSAKWRTIENQKQVRERLDSKVPLTQIIDEFVEYDATRISWSRDLKRDLTRVENLRFNPHSMRTAIYRPYVKQYLYFDRVVNEEIYSYPRILPTEQAEQDNLLICVTAPGNNSPFNCLITKSLADVHLTGDSTCFPFFTYDDNGSNRKENISDEVLDRCREKIADAGIQKWDIFYYAYAVLHHSEYRAKYSANLKRELPRIPFIPNFWTFAVAGKKLAEIHVNYEEQPEYKLEMIENGKLALNWRVNRMKYNKDKTAIIYNDFLTIGDIPSEVHEYRLGNRSALDWIVDQYKVSTDKRSGITNDPNRNDDPQYIVRLIKKIVTVSLRTNEIVKALPPID